MEGKVVWFTGLPCSGKTTIAREIMKRLKEEGYDVELLDGDVLRSYVRNTDFSREGRSKHLRYVALMARLLEKRGVIVLCSFVSPYRENREFARFICKNFIEVYVKAPIEVCIKRDTKGLYKAALSGKIKGFTGVDDPYEEPENPEVVIETDKESVEDGVQKVLRKIFS